VDMWIANAGLLWMLLFAGIIAWRRPGAPQARIIALWLMLFSIGVNFQVQNWDTPWPMLDAALAAVDGFIFYPALALIATYANLFARPLSPFRKAVTALAYVYVLVIGVATAVMWIKSAFGGVPPAPFSIVDHAQYFTYVLIFVPVVVALSTTRGAEREQLAWTTASLAPLYFLWFAGALSQDPTFQRIVNYALNVAFAVAPLGLTYAALSRRLLDIGFTINRVAVFTIVSVIVVGVFVLAEWLLTEVLGIGRNGNLAVAAGLTLVLGFSVRYIHNRVDHVLDRVFFRKRHDDEHAIRAFGHEAAYITDSNLVVERAKNILGDHADASFASFALQNGDHAYGLNRRK
jgi:hypothetical protein